LAALGRVWLSAVAALARYRPQIMYLYLAQNRTGFVRDAVLILTGRLFGARIVAHVRGGNFGNYYAHAPSAERRFIRVVLARLSRVILVAARFRPQFHGLVPESHVAVVYNGLDAPLRAALRARRSDRPGCRLLFMGHLSVAKGFGDLLRALHVVLAADDVVRFAAAGEWLETERNIHYDEQGRPLPAGVALRDEWSALTARFGERVTCLGRLDADAKIGALRDADIFVLPSYSEGFPMAALEAMAAGLPLVVTPVGALPEILDEPRHALFVRPGDVAGLADALLALVADPPRRAVMGAANRALVEQRFTFDAAQAGLRSVLQDSVAAP
jgi:glycosyltransferase involved in cell wall biosynthesis